jgi:hypothetical protein
MTNYEVLKNLATGVLDDVNPGKIRIYLDSSIWFNARKLHAFSQEKSFLFNHLRISTSEIRQKFLLIRWFLIWASISSRMKLLLLANRRQARKKVKSGRT